MRNWEGVICVEGEQTGDGRFIVEGALEWSDPPLPLGILTEEMHGQLLTGGVQIGTIDTITREGTEIRSSGTIDDDTEAGGELCRQMDAGTAAHGNETYVSVDPDDWELEIVVTEDEDEEGGIIMLASGSGPVADWRSLVAAAGDGDPEEDGTVVWTDAADSVIARYTRMRIRGATVCSIPAFDRCIIRLTDSAGETATEDEPESETAASLLAASIPNRPPAAWFEDPDFGAAGEDDRLVEFPNSPGVFACPHTVLEGGQVFGHLASWNQCHTGSAEGQCTPPPRSPSGYAYFLTGEIQPEDCDCDAIPVGQLTLAGGHASTSPGTTMRAAVEHYDNTESAIADVVVGEDAYGIWFAGALRPGVTEEQIRVFRASPLSGDWRRVGGRLELVAALAVNSQGFPIPRVTVASGRVEALVAAGVVPLRADRPEVVVNGFSDKDREALTRIAREARRAEAMGRIGVTIST